MYVLASCDTGISGMLGAHLNLISPVVMGFKSAMYIYFLL